MTETDALYDVRERTGNPAHASVDDVITLVLDGARKPCENHHNAHFDEAMAVVVDRLFRRLLGRLNGSLRLRRKR